MPDRDTLSRIPGTAALPVTSKNDSPQNQYQQQKKKRQNQEKPDETSTDIQPQIEDLDTNDLTDYSSIILNKRNTELKLFVHVKNDSQSTDENLKNELQANSLLLQSKIAEYDRELAEYDLTSRRDTIYGVRPQDNILDETVDNITKLYSLYQIYFECVKNEKSILNIDDIDFLDDIIRQKDDILNQIDTVRKEINFALFTPLPEKDENKIKVNLLLSDIHNIIGDIFRQEDENRVELQAVKEKMKLEIARQDRGAKAISQFATPNVKSHFIDKKT